MGLWRDSEGAEGPVASAFIVRKTVGALQWSDSVGNGTKAKAIEKKTQNRKEKRKVLVWILLNKTAL